VIGFKRYAKAAASFTLEKAQHITGIKAETIKSLAFTYARAKKASIYIGFGMQRYSNGGNSVRCIDALGAITGKIGRPGCGVNYAAKSLSPFLYDLEKRSQKYIQSSRRFTVGELGEFLEKAKEPPVKAIFVASGNPLTQSPDLRKTIRAFSKIEFKVVLDHFMTDTARHADVVIPAAFIFEQEDIIATSMYSPVLNWSQKAVDPVSDIMPEFDFYLKLAQKMGIKNFGFNDSVSYLEKSVQPLKEKLKIQNLFDPDTYAWIEKDRIAWKEKNLKHHQGK
jgi:anaerobic selenocysteine-containing dehydrogenase